MVNVQFKRSSSLALAVVFLLVRPAVALPIDSSINMYSREYNPSAITPTNPGAWTESLYPNKPFGGIFTKQMGRRELDIEPYLARRETFADFEEFGKRSEIAVEDQEQRRSLASESDSFLESRESNKEWLRRELALDRAIEERGFKEWFNEHFQDEWRR